MTISNNRSGVSIDGAAVASSCQEHCSGPRGRSFTLSYVEAIPRREEADALTREHRTRPGSIPLRSSRACSFMYLLGASSKH